MKTNHQIFACKMRQRVLEIIYRANASHIGSCFSSVDLLAVLYNGVLRVDPKNPNWDERDRFILSKGHAAAAIYSVLAEKGFFPKEWLDTYCQDGSKLGGHITHNEIPGVEVSTGSLGHGLSIGCGMALAAKRDSKNHRVFVLLSDGECDEGSVWEASLFAAQQKLDNLCAIIDYNKLQGFGEVSETINLEPFAKKWEAFNWSIREIDGHNYEQIDETLKTIPIKKNNPTVIIAHTIKGKGVSFMENKLSWHYKSPNMEEYDKAMYELEKTA